MSLLTSKIPVSIDVFEKVAQLTGKLNDADSEIKERSARLRFAATQLAKSSEFWDVKKLQANLNQSEEIIQTME